MVSSGSVERRRRRKKKKIIIIVVSLLFFPISGSAAVDLLHRSKTQQAMQPEKICTYL